MTALQLVSVLFGLYMFYWSFLVYKKRLIFVREFFFWFLVWLFFVLAVLFPDSTKLVLQTFRITRAMDLFMIISFMVLWLVTYRNYIENRRVKRKLQDLVRQEAINGVVGMKLKGKKKVKR